MKAAVVDSFGAQLRIEERDVPEPGPGQVLVRLEASGLCHTDIHAARGDWPVKPTPPFVPGHEGVGVVEAVGDGVTARAVGDRVALPWLGHACGHCDHCVAGWETLCEEQQNTGYSIDGCFADHTVADATYAVPVPDGVSSFDAAPLTCAGVTTYKAVKVAHVRPTERVAVFGIGGLGHLAVQYARIVGGTVIAVDVDDDKLAMAAELGADHLVNAATQDPVAAIESLGGADVAIVLAVIPEVFEQAFAALRRGGRLVCVGLPPESDGPMALPIFPTVLKGISVIGSIVGTRQDLLEVFDLHARGRTRVIAEPRKLDDVNAAIDEVLAGRTTARIVFEMWGPTPQHLRAARLQVRADRRHGQVQHDQVHADQFRCARASTPRDRPATLEAPWRRPNPDRRASWAPTRRRSCGWRAPVTPAASRC
ncbi:alcohol dehydrogenase AdhP [Nocardioides sp. TF02-7]|uniref:alcohol dehydrogenase AdhP n=1 Tax=Nocardioides sp. TF02-7 TaxID=2917724 RepID=UPI001F0651AE|nr:alcohol dehydrogenase AdhP [Nocardioides sp. TF02-7]UMG91890.1 alcohol dehydrogenase AdhP [Nocardioides sp. TF02-7]